MQFDLHADTPLLTHWIGYDFCSRHRPTPGGALFSHLDIPRMEEGGLDAQLFGMVGMPLGGDAYGTIHSMIDTLEDAERNSHGKFKLTRTISDLRQARQSGARVGMLSIEGVHPLRGSLERAQDLIDRGVVSFGILHFNSNAAGYPAMGWGRNDALGLTSFGKDLVRFLGENKCLVDLTHINEKGFDDAVEIASGPVFVSHTGVRGVHDLWRNLRDEQIRTIASKGGVMGVIFARQFLGGNNIDAVVKHILHLVNVGGEACAALGSDFDGFIIPVKGLRDISGLPALREALERKGLAPRVVDGIMGENALKLFETSLG